MNAPTDTAELIQTGTALTAPAPTDLQALFSAPDGIKAELARIKAKAMDAAKGLDVARKKDRETLKSVAFAVVKRKTALDQAGKDLNEERRKLNAAVDEERRMVRADLDKLADDLRAPVEKWEVAEEARIHTLAVRLDASFGAAPLPTASADLLTMRAVVDAVPLDATWAEFLGEATAMKAKRLEVLDREIDIALEREDREAELAKLRQEAADRQEADRLREVAEAEKASEAQRVADEAADAARAAQEAADAARVKAETEAADLRRLLAEAEEKAIQAAARELQAKVDAEAQRVAAIKAEEDRLAREAEAERQATIDADLKAAAEAQEVLDAAARKQAEEDHEAATAAERAARFDAVFAAVVTALADLLEFTPETVATAIFAGDVPNVAAVL